MKPDDNSQPWKPIIRDFAGNVLTGTLPASIGDLSVDPNRQSPYANRLNVRFGFEFPIRKTKSRKPKAEESSQNDPK